MMCRTILMLIVIISSYQVMACDCAYRKSVKEVFAQTSYILDVNVIQALFDHPLDHSQSYLDSLSQTYRRYFLGPVRANQYLLQVKQVYKGEMLTDTILLRTGAHSGVCGLFLEEGRRYILYASEVTDGHRYFDTYSKTIVLVSSICSRTAKYSIWEECKLKKAGRREKKATASGN